LACAAYNKKRRILTGSTKLYGEIALILLHGKKNFSTLLGSLFIDSVSRGFFQFKAARMKI
jgi:hypothetical protein